MMDLEEILWSTGCNCFDARRNFMQKIVLGVTFKERA